MSQPKKKKSKVELLLELSDYLRTIEEEKKKRIDRSESVDSFSEVADAFLLHAPMLLGTYTRNELRDCFGSSARGEAV
jgi:acetone carboxylase gamma subunit